MDKRYAIGNFICELRQEKGFTQKELGELMGVTNKAVSKWENGASLPRAEELSKLSVILGCTMDELLNGRRLEDGDRTGEHNETEPISEPRELTEEEKRLIELYSPYHPTEEESYRKKKTVLKKDFPNAGRAIELLTANKKLLIAGVIMLFAGYGPSVLDGSKSSVLGCLGDGFLYWGLGLSAAAVFALIFGLFRACVDEKAFLRSIIAYAASLTVFGMSAVILMQSGKGVSSLVSFAELLNVLPAVLVVSGIKMLAMYCPDGDEVLKASKKMMPAVAAAGVTKAVILGVYSVFFGQSLFLTRVDAPEPNFAVTIAVCGAWAAITIIMAIINLRYYKNVKEMLDE